jgi:hypothetical protein
MRIKSKGRRRLAGARRTGPVVLAWLLAIVAGCGGSGGGGTEPSAPPSRSGSGGTLKVTVRDVFGAPVSGAQVLVSSHAGPPPSPPASMTDASGKAEIRAVPAGAFVLEARKAGGFGYLGMGSNIGNDSVLDVEMVMHPASQDAGGVIRAWVPEGGLSADGRTLEFKLQLSDVPGETRIYSYYSDSADEDGDPWSGVRIEACWPTAVNDTVEQHQADCVVGPSGFDAAYAGVPSAAPLGLERMAEPTPNWSIYGDPFVVPFRTILLVEQGGSVIADDSGDQRLLAARYFLKYAGAGMFSAMLGAFAADDPTAAAGLVLLPQKPLTVFPVENPGFTLDGRSHFPTLDSLQVMEGGVSPLFAAIDRAIDLQVAAGGTLPRSVVVITNGGHDYTCGIRASCRAARDAVVRKSRDTGVAIVVVGYDGSNAPDWETLGLLGQGAPGSATFWAGDPLALAPTLRTVRKYLSQMKKSAIVTFRIESPSAGAFTSGRTVLGRVFYGGGCAFDCGFDVPGTPIPFAVKIP